MKRGGLAVLVTAGMLTAAACSEPTTIGDQLVGTWTMAAYADHGTPAVTTGTWTFFADATFLVLGSITFEGEPRDSLEVQGEWREQGAASIAMTVAGETTIWNVTMAPDTAVIELPDTAGVVRITLTQ